MSTTKEALENLLREEQRLRLTPERLGDRCGKCPNCRNLEKIQRRVLACVNPPFSRADDGVVKLWNRELEMLPCTDQVPKKEKQR